MNNNTQIIDQYLQNEMSEAEKQAFEQRLSIDTQLKEELEIQKQIIEAARNAGIKTSFSRALKQKILMKNISIFIITVGIVAIGIIAFLKWNNWFGHSTNSKIENNTAQQIIIATQRDTIIETPDGVVFAIPANAFKTDAKTIELQIQTALSPANIIKQGLSTSSNGELLQTAGMFSINGISGIDKLQLQKEIQVSVPAKEINPKMQLFDGVKDATGNINWVNPKPIQRNLRTYDITSLNFYPPRYISTLKALGKNVADRKYTDSLYYSFAGWPFFVKNYRDTGITIFPENYPQYKKDSIHSENVKDMDKYNAEPVSHEYHEEINPAKIKAIWDKKFNNTILATKEFEERLHFLHGFCTDEGLNFYVENINKPLYYTDDFIYKNTTNVTIKKKFKKFVNRKDGGVAIAAGMQQKLNEYFQNKYKAYQQASISTWQKFNAALKILDTIANTKRRQQAKEEIIRNQNNFTEEYCANLTEAYRQVGVTKTCNDTLPKPPDKDYYNVTITTPGWKNLDMYVYEATANRQSMTYTDPASGKTSALTYKECSIEIESKENYDKILVYLIPNGLNSFQRMNLKDGNYKENLNMLFTYDAIAVAYKGTNAFYYKEAGIKPQHYIFKLPAINESTLNNSLNYYNKIKQTGLFEEFKYQLFEQQEAERQLNLRKEADFKTKVAESIFSCDGEGATESLFGRPMPDAK